MEMERVYVEQISKDQSLQSGMPPLTRGYIYMGNGRASATLLSYIGAKKLTGADSSAYIHT